MQGEKVDSVFSTPVIDVPATSKKLKELRESRDISVAQLQKILGMENPQSIYTWESSENKYLPRLDNLVALAKLYDVSMDEMIVVKMRKNDALAVSAPSVFISINASLETKLALENYYILSFLVL